MGVNNNQSWCCFAKAHVTARWRCCGRCLLDIYIQHANCLFLPFYRNRKVGDSSCNTYRCVCDNTKSAKIQGYLLHFSYFCIRREETLSKTYEKKKKRYAYFVIWKRRKLSNLAQRRHSGSHAIAWAAITIFVLKGFLRPPNQNMALQYHAL